MTRNFILAVVVAGFAAGTAVAADDAAPPAAAQAPAADQAAPPAGWHGDHFGAAPDGVEVHRGEGPNGSGWSDGGGGWHRYDDWHGGGPRSWSAAPAGWRGRGGWAGGDRDYGRYPHGYNVQIIPGNYAYRHFSHGGTVPPLWRDDRFYVREWFAFGLTEPAFGYRWIRYYNDALLINVSTGAVAEVMPDIDWGRAYMAPAAYGPGYGYGPPWGWSGYHYGWVMPASMVVMTPVTKTVVTEEYVPSPKHWRASRHHRAKGCNCN